MKAYKLWEIHNAEPESEWVPAEEVVRMRAQLQAEALKSVRDDYCIKSQLGKNPSLYVVLDEHLAELLHQADGDSHEDAQV